jgi:hypothetical protein
VTPMGDPTGFSYRTQMLEITLVAKQENPRETCCSTQVA